MKAIFVFLSSVYFALFLIAQVAILTAIATFIEAKSGSHLFAMESIFSTIYYLSLLAGFFINILFSLIKRLWSKKASYPFVLAHIGLLIVLTGAGLKERYGFQAYIVLREGEEKRSALKEESLGLSYRLLGDKDWHSIPLQKEEAMSLGPYQAKMVAFYPHGSEEILPFIADNRLYLEGQEAIPLGEPIQRAKWTIAGYKEKPTEPLSSPSITFIDHEDHVEAIAFQESETASSFSKKSIDRLYMYDEGFKGYTVPFTFFGEELEAPLITRYKPESRLTKREEERPLIRLEMDNQERRHLLFNKMGQALPSPMQEGKLLIKFGPEEIPLPHRIRLRRAHTHYTGKKVAGFQAFLYIDDQPALLSMNQVHETDEGLRFYLSSIAPQDETDVKTVKIVVNYDPYKYWLTYPGCLMVAMGGLLLLFGVKKKTPHST